MLSLPGCRLVALLASCLLVSLSSCSIQTQLARAVADTQMRERISSFQPKEGAVRVLLYDSAFQALPGVTQIKPTRKLFIPALFYWQYDRNYDILPGQRNLRFLTSNLQLAFEEEIERQGGIPNCPNCRLEVQLDTLKARVPYYYRAITVYVLIYGLSYHDEHMGPSPFALHVRYSLWNGDQEVYRGFRRIQQWAPAKPPGFFQGTKGMARKYMDLYYDHVDSQLRFTAAGVVTDLRKFASASQ